THETLGRLYAMHWPALQPAHGRGVRRVPLLEQLRATGAAVGEAAGWEREAWFEPGATQDPLWIYDFGRPACSACAPPTSTSRSVASCTRSSATSAAASRWTRP